MKQEEFFKLLDRRLSMIEDSERSDILNEYRQHIAMKIQDDGISEEEALADFGDVDDFADEILSAYHVRAGASIQEPAPKKAHDLLPKLKTTAETAWDSVKAFFCRCGRGIARFFSACGRGTARFFSGCREKVGTLLHREPKEKIPRPKTEGESIWKKCGVWLVFAVKTLLRWCRNLICGGVCLLAGAFGALLLVLFGACVVVTIQGYPLVGMTIVLFGLLLCSVAATAFFGGLIRRRPKLAEEKGVAEHE